MASLDIVLNDFKTAVLTGLAPYQPNLPPTYPNPGPHAGEIVPTLVTAGHPIQYHILARMENGLGQVAVYDQGPGKPMPYIDEVTPSFTSPMVSGQGTVLYEVARSLQQIIVEIWAPGREERRGISGRIRRLLGDYFRLYHADGTVTLLRFTNQVDWDQEQVDTIYIRRMYYMADYVEVLDVDVTTVTEAISTLTIQT